MCGPERCVASVLENMKKIWDMFGSLPFQTDRLSNALVGCILAVLRAGCTAPQDDNEDAFEVDRELFDRVNGRSREHGPHGILGS